MKKPGFLLAFVLIAGLFAGTLLSGCAGDDSGKLKVVTSTTMMAQITERIGGDKVEVVNIIPPAQCPGHFDVKPGDIQKLADAALFLIHNWQGEKFSDKLVASANNNNLVTVKIEVAGNWMTPAVQSAATEKILEALKQADPDNAAVYQEGADNYKAAVAAKEAEAGEKLSKANLDTVNVLCDEQQAKVRCRRA